MARGWSSIWIRVSLAIILAGCAIAAMRADGGRANPVADRPADAPIIEPANTVEPKPAPVASVAQAAPASNVAIAVAQPNLADEAMRMIEFFENRRHAVYADSRGNRTIGVGFNLDRPGAADDIARVLPGVTRGALIAKRTRLTDAQIDRLLRYDVERAIETARRQVPNFDTLPHDVRLVLVDLCYNVGGLAKWTKFCAAVERRDFTGAANLMAATRWYRQTGRRAVATTRMMRDAAKS